MVYLPYQYSCWGKDSVSYVDGFSALPHYAVTISVYDTEIRNIYNGMASLKVMQLNINLCTLGVILYPCLKASTMCPYICTIKIFKDH